jgi:RES domain-containing protein
VISIWRIDKKLHSASSFSGEGAALYGGRWNPQGVRVVYASQTLALAALEKFVHLEGVAGGISFVSFKIDVPGSVKIKHLEFAHLPKNWRTVPAPASTWDIGLNWAQKNESAILRVPSTIIPSEYDYLINPLHPDFHSLKISKPSPFSFDPRLWK